MSDDAQQTRLTGVRALIARRMQNSLAEAAQLTFSARFDASALQARRVRENVSAADIIAYQFVQLLRQVPDFNATLKDGVLYRSSTVNIGVAVATKNHLVVPVVRSADQMTLAEFHADRRELAERAQSGTLCADEMQGGTSTVSNLGRGRVEAFTPILNPPEVALLGVAAINPSPWVSAGGTIEVVPVGNLSLTVDHRVIDGAPANQFLTQLCLELEGV